MNIDLNKTPEQNLLTVINGDKGTLTLDQIEIQSVNLKDRPNENGANSQCSFSARTNSGVGAASIDYSRNDLAGLVQDKSVYLDSGATFSDFTQAVQDTLGLLVSDLFFNVVTDQESKSQLSDQAMFTVPAAGAEPVDVRIFTKDKSFSDDTVDFSMLYCGEAIIRVCNKKDQ